MALQLSSINHQNSCVPLNKDKGMKPDANSQCDDGEVPEQLILRNVSLNAIDVISIVSRGIILRYVTARSSILTCGSVIIENSNVLNVFTEEEVELESTTSHGKIVADGYIIAKRCQQLGELFSQNFIKITDCPMIKKIWGCSDLVLSNVVVVSDVHSSGRATIENSKICGTLSCSANRLIVVKSIINRIQLSHPPACMKQPASKFTYVSKVSKFIVELWDSTVNEVNFIDDIGTVLQYGSSAVNSVQIT